MILITDEMYHYALNEVKRRQLYLNPHFKLDYLKEDLRQIIGFIGEFACQEYLGIDWKTNIRESYLVADSYDFVINNKRADVKTETIPNKMILEKVVSRKIGDDEPYGRRLIHEKQYTNNLNKYDLIIFGCIKRPDRDIIGEFWYPIGFIYTKFVLGNYSPTINTPFNTKYRERCINIKTSDLDTLQNLIK